MARDYKVRIIDREGIAKIAMSWWLIANKLGHSFNICTFVTEVLAKRLRNKGALQIQFYHYDDLPEKACVTFSPLTLHIVKQIWIDADLGKPYARRVIAHEIGHIVLHDNNAVAFSEDKLAQLSFTQDEESGEWQANIFADYFLVPDHVALKLRAPDIIAGLCVVTDSLADRRLREATSAKEILRPKYEGDPCRECSNFTLLRDGCIIRCDTCGNSRRD